MSAPNIESLNIDANGEPLLSRSYTLKFVGDWGGANFHRICSWLTQEFCDRAGPQSSTTISSLRDGGLDGLKQVEAGDVHLTIGTPAMLLKKVLAGDFLSKKPMPHLRALGVIPQNDRMVLAIHPKYNIKTFEELRKQKPALTIATSVNDGTNFIGYVAEKYMEAHGVSKAELESWGGKWLFRTRPEQSTGLAESGDADALLQEAIMTPWWRSLIDGNKLVPLAAESTALEYLEESLGLRNNPLPAGYWDNLAEDLPALDFSDFVICVRDDLPIEVAYLLTWCLVETRNMLEIQYRHLPPARSPVSYPLEPRRMAQAPIPLHPGAQQYYSKTGHI